mmetsp:Transcript_3413/g.5223  ORF Transcript_3413/g.5223 Transcript_3413/m.5223 type:complete len:338 (-) Transcript_3413:302-1315(-)
MAELNEDITNLRVKIEEVETEIKQVRAALEWHMAFTDEEKQNALERAGMYSNTNYWSYDKLQSRLSELLTDLVAKETKENLLLEEKRLERASRGSQFGREDHTDEADELSTPQRRRRFFKVSALFKNGATWRHLRKIMFEVADRQQGIKGHIRYCDPVAPDSDLELLLYFKTDFEARMMCSAIINEYQKYYSSGTRPFVKVSEAEANEVRDPEALITTGDYVRSISPKRDTFDIDRDDTQSHSTATCPDYVQRHECIFDPLKCGGKVHAAHINAKLKKTQADSNGNLIPLPASVHTIFDSNTSGADMPLFSIEPVTKVEELVPGDWDTKEYFQKVTV